jgi:transposase-like protein
MVHDETSQNRQEASRSPDSHKPSKANFSTPINIMPLPSPETLATPMRSSLSREILMPELTSIQSQVLAGLLAGKSVSAVARENGIHRSTIYQWRHDQPYFTLALDQARSRHQTALFDHVQDLAEQALERERGTGNEENKTALKAADSCGAVSSVQPFDVPSRGTPTTSLITQDDGLTRH